MKYLGLIPSKCPMAERLLVSGEMPMGALGDTAVAWLSDVNDALIDPLFIPTANGTMRMTRWSANRVFRAVGKDDMDRILDSEKNRLGIHKLPPTNSAFYQNALEVNFTQEKYAPQSGNMVLTAMERYYLNACLVFNNFRMYDILPSAFFSAFTFHGIKLADLTKEQREKRDAISNDWYMYLTEEQLRFLHTL
jgi:hypothetical protein